MRVGQASATELLGELKLLLGSDQLPVQEEIATAAGVHQSLVSRARNGQLRRITDKVQALLAYARSRAEAEAVAAAAIEAADTDPNGTVIETDGAKRGRETRAAARRGGDAAESFRREALDGVETYLKEGYDPRLIVEQLAVLRRAQRIRRPGRPPA